MGHVLYHHPWSKTGLWALLRRGAGRPHSARHRRGRVTGREPSPPPCSWRRRRGSSTSARPLLEGQGLEGALRAWPLLATTATLFLVGVAGRLYPPVWETSRPLPDQPRLLHQMLALLGHYGGTLHTATAWVATVVAVLLQLVHYGRPFAHPDIALLCALYAGLAVAWYHEGRSERVRLGYTMAELCLLALFAAGRRQLLLTTTLWTYEYDVWASLAASFVLAGAKQAFDDRPRELRLPSRPRCSPCPSSRSSGPSSITWAPTSRWSWSACTA